MGRTGMIAAWWAILAGVIGSAAGADAPATPIIPRPVSVQPKPGMFQLSAHTIVQTNVGDKQAAQVARYLTDGLSQAVGREVTLKEGEVSDPADSTILLVCGPTAAKQGPEGYTLTVEPHHITIRAQAPAGLFYGVQSLRQLLPAEFERPPQEGEDRTCPMPAVQIEDRPRFKWRGLMLDCSRTFLSIDYLKRYVDLLACHKMNVLHLHLTDDQGWRVEIDKYPKLTEIGSHWDVRVHDGPDGFYAKEQLRELVAYAAQRFVTIVPEIEMPAHCLSALAAYPELACREDRYYIVPFHMMGDPKAKPPPPAYGVLCAGNEQVYEFVENVLAEVIELFPSAYIHIGGDECPKQFWKACPKCQARMKAEGLANEEELQSYFIKRVEKIVSAHGRRMIGWDEILEGGLAGGAAVMSWRGMEGGIAAAQQGHEVIVADRSALYFDYPHDVTPVRKVYTYEPIPAGLSAEQAALVLGAQGQMWTHIARDEREIDTGIFPRMVALSEVVWSPAALRDWPNFEQRLTMHLRRLQVLHVPYYRPSPFLGLQRALKEQKGAAEPPIVRPKQTPPKEQPKPQEAPVEEEVDPTAPTDAQR